MSFRGALARSLIRAVDTVVLIPALLIAWAVAVPISRLRRQWLARRPQQGPTVGLLLQSGALRALRVHGEHVVRFYHPITGIPRQILLDPSAEEPGAANLGPDFEVIAWRQPALSRWADKVGLRESAIWLREAAVMWRLVDFAATEGVSFVRSATHEVIALRGQVVSDTLQIPHIISVAGNYELLRRLLGELRYFNSYYRFPVIGCFARMANAWLLRIPIQRAAWVMGRNKNNYEHAFALGAEIERLSLVRIRLNPRFFEPVPQDRAPPLGGRPFILFVARFSAEKYPSDTIEVFELVARRHDGIDLVMIGSGPLSDSLAARRARSPFADRIHLLGALPNDDVWRWTAHARIALEWYSGSALVEKMLCGVPVVAYDVEWMSEVVIDGYTGYLVDFRDTQTAAEVCLMLLHNGAAARRIGENARQLARAMFNVDTVLEKERRIVTRLVSAAAPDKGE